MDNERVVREDHKDELQNVKDLQLLEWLHLGNDSDDTIPLLEHGHDYTTRLIVKVRLMIKLIPIMMIISNACMFRTN